MEIHVTIDGPAARRQTEERRLELIEAFLSRGVALTMQNGGAEKLYPEELLRDAALQKILRDYAQVLKIFLQLKQGLVREEALIRTKLREDIRGWDAVRILYALLKFPLIHKTKRDLLATFDMLAPELLRRMEEEGLTTP